MGYNGHIYRKGEYVEVNTPEEVKRLVGYDVVEKYPVVEKAITELVPPQKVPEKSGTGMIKGIPKLNNKDKNRGKKK